MGVLRQKYLIGKNWHSEKKSYSRISEIYQFKHQATKNLSLFSNLIETTFPMEKIFMIFKELTIEEFIKYNKDTANFLRVKNR